MKIKSITTFLIIAIVALLVAYYFLGMGYLRQRQGNEALAVQITRATQTLAQTSEPPQDLEQRLAAAQASLAATQSAFPTDLNSTRIINYILKLADACQVRAIPLVTKPWSKENIGKGYYAFRLSVSARGSFSQLTSFVSRLENGELETLFIENFSVSRVAGATGEAAAVTASLDIVIYANPPSPK